jgi:hypothetical protein
MTPHTAPAFPHSHVVYSHGQASYEDSDYADGMTLRDYFAAKAMHGLLSCQHLTGVPQEIAAASYSYADAMLKAREETP